jgi:transposase-like protein
MTSIVDSDGDRNLIRADSRGRVIVGPSRREALLDAYEQSGQTAMAFCRQHDLKYPTFATWVQKRRRQSASSGPAFAEVMIEAQSARTPDVEPLRITLPEGTLIEISERKQLPWVLELLRLLNPTRPC